MQSFSPRYILGFSALVCIICSLAVSLTAVGLRERQQTNALLDKQHKVLIAAGLVRRDERLSRSDIEHRFKGVRPVVIDLQTGNPAEEIDPATFDQHAAARDPQQSRPAPENSAQVLRLPLRAIVYEVKRDTKMDLVVLPIYGKGLWSTLYGFLALDADGTTVRGITYYQHGETPGLGGEVDNPNWQDRWHNRRVFDSNGEVKLKLTKGSAGRPEEDPHRVDGLSGATITSRGVSAMIELWLGPDGFGPYLQRLNRGEHQE